MNQEIEEQLEKVDYSSNEEMLLRKKQNTDANKIDRLSEELQTLQDANYISKITAKRGRLIREIKREIAKVKKLEKQDENVSELLEQLEIRLKSEIENHKNQLDDRYNKEFQDKEATVPAVITVLPKGVGLQVEKVATCIQEMTIAKTNKQKIFAALNVAKSLGMLAATPVIFTAKFIAKHWYMIALLVSLIKLPGIKINIKKDDYNNSDLQTENAYETVTVEEPEAIAKPATKPATNPLLQPGPIPMPTTEPEKNPGLVSKPGLAHGLSPEISEMNPANMIDDSNSEQISEVMGNFVKGLERNYNFLIGEGHENIKVVHSTDEYIAAVKELIGLDVSPTEASKVYLSSIENMKAVDRLIVWPEMEQARVQIPVKYFETYSDLADYVISGKEENLTNYYNDFAERQDQSFLENLKSNAIVEGIGEKLGVPVTTAALIFVVYEAVQYGLAPATGGASLLLPG